MNGTFSSSTALGMVIGCDVELGGFCPPFSRCAVAWEVLC